MPIDGNKVFMLCMYILLERSLQLYVYWCGRGHEWFYFLHFYKWTAINKLWLAAFVQPAYFRYTAHRGFRFNLWGTHFLLILSIFTEILRLRNHRDVCVDYLFGIFWQNEELTNQLVLIDISYLTFVREKIWPFAKIVTVLFQFKKVFYDYVCTSSFLFAAWMLLQVALLNNIKSTNMTSTLQL